MKFADLIALAKQGYTPKDIRELLSLGDNPTKNGTDFPPDQTATNDNEDDPNSNNEGNGDGNENPTPDQNTEDKNSPTLDSAKGGDEIAELKKKLEEMQAALEKAQKANVDKELDKKPDDLDSKLSDMFREFM